MSLRKLPEARTFPRPQNLQWDAPSDVFSRWAETPLAAAEGVDTITIFDVIGEDMWTGGGFTAKRMSAALRSIGNKPVTVQINSPGGDLFEGIAIYNMLRAHPARVTVEVMGWAASAASVIAMAGDEIVMGLGTFMMVHNAWGVVVGNRHDFTEAAGLFETFDGAIADIYEARTGAKRKDIEKLMDAETFMGPTEALANGFADRVDDTLSAEASAEASEIHAKRRLDAYLSKAGLARADRRRLFSILSGGTHDAAASATHDAGVTAALEQLLSTIHN
jgi:ATP-dependent Clp protease protease subunit